MRGSWIYPLLVAGVIAQGCTESEAEIANGDDPLRALASGEVSERYTSSYWSQKMTEDPNLWAQAVAYCGENQGADYPNCTAVRYARALEVNSRPPEYEANTSLRPGARSQPPDDPR